MSNPADWHDNNTRHLGAGLTWLRLRLNRLIEHDSSVAQNVIQNAAETMFTAESADPSPALVVLGERFELSRFEKDLLFLCLAPELDSNVRSLFAKANGNDALPYPTFGLALKLFEDPDWGALGPQATLRYGRFIEIHQSGAEPLIESPLRLDERILHFIKGLNYLDDRLIPLLHPLDDDGDESSTPAAHRVLAQEISHTLERSLSQGRLPVVHLLGQDSLPKKVIANLVSDALGLRAHRLSLELLPTQLAELETLTALWQRETRLLPISLYVDAFASSSEGGGRWFPPQLDRLLARSNGIVFLDTREPLTHSSFTTLTVDVHKPDFNEQRQAWASSLASAAENQPLILAAQFDLGLAAIDQIARTVRASSAEGQPLGKHLWNACVVRTRPALDALAQRLEPHSSWRDLMLPAPELRLIEQIAAQVKNRATVYEAWGFRERHHRGLGLSALFTGESGTGKTLAAEVLASELDLDLYRVDLSSVVSKYIGETEKNLRRLFDAADEGGGILFFDEADALFGKRSEVKDSHDRYANIEVNYLLQKMESYRGLSILATNLKSALDSSFLRRLRFVVPFSFPNETQRRAIWKISFPPTAPIEPLDLDRLAKLKLTGGSIHNISLTAAFLAAEAKTNITMSLILDSARAEFRKLERPVDEMDFRIE